VAYEHVLVLFDGTPEAEAGLAAASELAFRERALLTVAAVVELEPPCRGCSIGTSVWNDVMRDAARGDLDRAAKLVDMPARFELLCGEPGTALVDGALALGCDAIMLPARPHRRLGRVRGRDRAPAIRRRAHCPVLQPN
jgi:nucleotide-binding universal stress UspA family protein